MILKHGKGNSFHDGDKIKVHFEAKLSNGDYVESTKMAGMAFRFLKGDQNVIEGWNEAFNYLREGDEAIVIVPAHLGYGEVGLLEPGTTDVYMIPPGELTYFEINKITLVKPGKENEMRTVSTASTRR
ncbi:MAG: FKBP-type peptidyl-prolyl cis-trans isomerase [Cytophagales bacterium]